MFEKWVFQNRQFVFKSDILEDIGKFRQRMDAWFPKSIMLAHSMPPTDTELNSNLQCTFSTI